MGFWEMMVILVVALLVVGPEKLPGIARTLGRWVGQTKAYINTVKNDIDRDLRLQELQDMMRQNEHYNPLEIIEKSAPKNPPEQSAPPETKS